MQRSLFTVNVLLMGAALLAGNATAQQTPTVPAKTQTGTATKTRHTTTATKPKPLVLSTQKDKASYAIGLNIGKGLSRDAVDVDPKIVLKGLEDALSGSKPLLTDDEVKATLMALQEDLRKKQEEKRQALIETNKAQGVTFLAANSKKDGVVTLPSGLQYKILTAGTGPKPTADDTVVCNYRGTLLDNTEFDSSYKRGQPASFAVNRVIKGWTEALQLMPVGSKWQLFIPADLAYGERGQGPVIGPNATLVFEVELLSIQDKPQAQTPAPQQTPPPQ
jgi:FKBP-type peptidyl-prolyl cis-trans isomerase FklB